MSSAERILSDLISTTEAAELMGVHRSTVERQLVHNGGQIIGKRIGGKWVVLRSSVPVPVSSPTIDGASPSSAGMPLAPWSSPSSEGLGGPTS